MLYFCIHIPPAQTYLYRHDPYICALRKTSLLLLRFFYLGQEHEILRPLALALPFKAPKLLSGFVLTWMLLALGFPSLETRSTHTMREPADQQSVTKSSKSFDPTSYLCSQQAIRRNGSCNVCQHCFSEINTLTVISDSN